MPPTISLRAQTYPDAAALSWGDGRGDGWTVDLDAIERAMRDLGLIMPVRVGLTNGRGGKAKHGIHFGANGQHDIRMVKHLSASYASEVLWHELGHACQLEFTFGCDNDAFARAYSMAGAYRTNPYELDAQRYESRAAAHPLVIA